MSEPQRVKIVIANPEAADRPELHMPAGGSSYLTREQMEEIRRTRAAGVMAAMRRLATDLHQGRVPADDPDVRAGLRELAGEIERFLGP